MEFWVWGGIAIGILFWVAGFPIWNAFAFSGLIFLLGQNFDAILLPQHFFQAMNTYTLMAVPFFLLAGGIMVRTRSADPLFRAASAWIGHLPGGLAIAAVIACMLFGAISASTLATMSAIGSLSIPSMVEAGYDKRKSMAYLCACGGLGNIIPPSIACIIFAALTETPVIVLFIAGIVPGVVLTIMLSITSAFVFKVKCPRASWKDRWQLSLKAVPALTIPVFILGGIYTGKMTPVEAAAFSCILALAVAAFYRSLVWKNIWNVAVEMAGVTSMIYFVFGATTFFMDMLAFANIPQKLVMLLVDAKLGPNELLIWLMGILFILGMLMDIVPLKFFILPLTYKAVTATGIHYITYNFLFMQMAAIGFCTPPFAAGIFTMGVLFKEPAESLFRAIWIFIAVLIIHAFLFIFWPEILLWLPKLIYGEKLAT